MHEEMYVHRLIDRIWERIIGPMREFISLINQLCSFIDSLKDFDPDVDDPQDAITAGQAILHTEDLLDAVKNMVRNLERQLDALGGYGWLLSILVKDPLQRIERAIRRKKQEIKNPFFRGYLDNVYEEFRDWERSMDIDRYNDTPIWVKSLLDELNTDSGDTGPRRDR